MKARISRVLMVNGLGVILCASGTWANAETEAKIKGSIVASGINQADFPKTAKISATDAGQIAISKTGGGILSVGLENEDGYLIYAVEVAGNRSGRHEVLVDAGDGKILSDMKKGFGSKEDNEAEDGEQDDD